MHFRSFFVLALGCSTSLFSCCDFLLFTEEGSHVVGRSLEFAVVGESFFQLYPRGLDIQAKAPNGQAGYRGKGKYGFIGALSFGLENPFDGMNEKGLSVAGLWLPTTEYQKVPSGKEGQAVSILDLSAVILSQCADVLEVKELLPRLYVYGEELAGLKMVPPIHIAFHDTQGKSLVAEYVGGELYLYDNPLHVLTNYPTFDWHLKNVGHFAQVNPHNPEPKQVENFTWVLPGSGGGLLGVPGDYMPSSRLVKLFINRVYGEKVKTSSEGVNQAFHFLNTVDIPKGVVRDALNQKHGTPPDFTQWVVVKELEKQRVYFRSYENPQVFAIDLSAISWDFPQKDIKKIPFDQKEAATFLSF